MPPPAEHHVTSLIGFTQAVESALAASRAVYGHDQSIINWYRGCGRSTNDELVPGLYRHPKIKDANTLLDLERQMLEWFRRESVLHQTKPEYLDPEDADFELLFFVQHYGFPTRLLDWTMNPFIGLYFAVTSAKIDEKTGDYLEDAAVWILSPNAWNERSLVDISWGNRGALSIQNSEKSGYAPRKNAEPMHLAQMYPLPVAMRGIANNTRMFAQKGVFTISGKSLEPLEIAFDIKDYRSESLVKLIIEKQHIDALMQSVLSIGYTDSVSYPDLHGLAMETKRTFGFKI
ncbi:MAG: FRG domain-containing protein [Acidobacteriota bacterium]